MTLNGLGSSAPNAAPLAYIWTLVSKPIGSVTTLTSPTGSSTHFNADVAGVYVVSLVVNDGKTDSAATLTTIAVTSAGPNVAPVANAGPAQNVSVGVVTLDGSASLDANADPLTYAWTLVSRPSGSVAALSSLTAVKPQFSANVVGTFVVALVVSDGKLSSAVSTVTITAFAANVPPVANAGPAQSAGTGLVTLNGSASLDANGDPLTYLWALTSKPVGSTAALTNPTSASPTFTADMAGSYVATLIVNDGKTNSAVASVSISVSAAAWQVQSTARTFTALSVTSDDTVNPLRGYYRWRGQEKVAQVSPALDAYQRYRWKDLETGLGTYNFATVLSDLQTAKTQGRKFALRVQMMLGYDDGLVYMPAYLVNHASCTASCGWWSTYHEGASPTTFVPDWNDPFVQQRASALLVALAAALGSQEDMAWIDIGMFGQWGEWALASGVNYATAPAGITAATDASKREFVDMHLRAFSARQMVMLAIYSRYNEVRYATTQQTIASKPVGMRIDCLGRGGFMNQWTNHAAEWATLQNVWQTAPFVAEYCQFLTGDPADNPTVALQQVRDFHISTVGNGNIGDGSVNSWASFTAAEQALFKQIGREAGYRYRIDTASVSLSASGALSVSALVRNDGNAPAYEPWDVVLELVNGAGTTAWSQTLPGSIKALTGAGASQTFSAPVQLPALTAGDYTLKLTARDGRRLSATPVRAALRWTIAERNAEGGVDLATLRKN